MRLFHLPVLIPVILVLCVGCASEYPEGMPKLYKAQLTLCYDDGTPIEGASVVFQTEDAQKTGTWVHSAITDANGTGKLMTQGKYDGLPAGKYSVTLAKYILEGVPPPRMPNNAEEQKAYDDYYKSGETQQRFFVIASEYSSVASTPLKSIEILPKNGQKLSLNAGEPVKVRQELPKVR